MTNDSLQNLENLLAVYLLDLRSQFEAELRELAHAQQALDEYRLSEGPRRVQARENLKQRLALLRGANSTIAEALTEAEREATLLFAQST